MKALGGDDNFLLMSASQHNLAVRAASGRVLAEAQDKSTPSGMADPSVNNANFATPPDGTPAASPDDTAAPELPAANSADSN